MNAIERNPNAIHETEQTKRNGEEFGYYRIWKIARDVFISSALWWYVSQPFLVAGLGFGAVFYKKSCAFPKNAAVWWQMADGFKLVIGLIFAVAAFPWLLKFGTFLWGAHVASEEIRQALEKNTLT